MTGIAFRNLSLARKIALIPALTVLLMAVMVGVTVHVSLRTTEAAQVLDRDVFAPLMQAQALKNGITLLHTRLFALLSVNANEADPAAQKAAAAALLQLLQTQSDAFDGLLGMPGLLPADRAAEARTDFVNYAARVREVAGFAAYDTSYGALVAAGADDLFVDLYGHFDGLVDGLSQRRTAVVAHTVVRGALLRQLLVALACAAAALALLGTVAVARGITVPLTALTALMQRLAGGDTAVAVPGTGRRDELGAMARAVEVFRANAIARLAGEAALRHTNMQFDAALNSMLQGLMVWGPDRRVQLVNGRYFEIIGLPAGAIVPGMTVAEVAAVHCRHGVHPGETEQEVAHRLDGLVSQRRSTQLDMAVREGVTAKVSLEPMTDGGCVVTFEDITEKRRNEERIAHMARHDVLTGLANRVMFRDRLEEAVARFDQGVGFAVFCLDLDHFKEVNDTLGHAVGDGLLRQVTERLRHTVRGHDVVARIGGDEFAVLMTEADGAPVASGMAARIIERISAPYDVDGHHIVIGASIGIARADRHSEAADLLKRADVALYKAKEERGTFCFFAPGMDEHLQVRRGLENDLRAAIHAGEFELYYQPLFNLAAARVTGFEALLRWHSPTRGMVAPGDFIPLAEQTGLIAPIGDWVLRTACAEAAGWPDDVKVAVNISPVQFRGKRLVELVQDALRATGLAPQRLELEITETVLLQDSDAVLSVLNRLHDLGVGIAMDDFGTGYSSLSYLRRFPFDKIKIDRSFVSDIDGPLSCELCTATCDRTQPSMDCASVIVRAIARLGDSLGIATTAEGVETATQLAQLRREGCTEVQGYLISPPRPAAEVAGLLARLNAAGADGRVPAPTLCQVA